MTIRSARALAATITSLLLLLSLLVRPAPAAAGGSPWFTESTPLALSVGGTYQPIVGNFVGDLADDIIWYAPGAATDYVWEARGNGTFDKRVLARQVTGAHRPIVGNFAGDARTDILWYAPGSTPDPLWDFSNDVITERPKSIGGTYTPYVIPDSRWGPGQGRTDKIIWMTPTTGGDSLWTFSGVQGTHTSRTITVSGSATPLIGDFDGDLDNDLFWYRPGLATDYLWTATSLDATYESTPFKVGGTYAPVVGDYTPFGDGRDDILWYHSGDATMNVWEGTGSPAVSLRFSRSSVAFGGSGMPIGLSSDWGYLLTYDPAGADRVWFLQNTVAPYSAPTGNTDLAAGYVPIVGVFAGLTPDVLWYKPGKAREVLFLD